VVSYTDDYVDYNAVLSDGHNGPSWTQRTRMGSASRFCHDHKLGAWVRLRRGAGSVVPHHGRQRRIPNQPVLNPFTEPSPTETIPIRPDLWANPAPSRQQPPATKEPAHSMRPTNRLENAPSLSYESSIRSTFSGPANDSATCYGCAQPRHWLGSIAPPVQICFPSTDVARPLEGCWSMPLAPIQRSWAAKLPLLYLFTPPSAQTQTRGCGPAPSCVEVGH
jgi:hypothetical protein